MIAMRKVHINLGTNRIVKLKVVRFAILFREYNGEI